MREDWSRRTAALAAFSGALLLALGCGPRDRSAPGLYRAYCARCHGAAGEGDRRSSKLYPNVDLTSAPRVLRGDREFLRGRIAKGHGPMPGFARRLAPEEIESLVDLTLAFPKQKAGR